MHQWPWAASDTGSSEIGTTSWHAQPSVGVRVRQPYMHDNTSNDDNHAHNN